MTGHRARLRGFCSRRPPATAEPDRLGAGAGRGGWTSGRCGTIFVLTLGYDRGGASTCRHLSEALGVPARCASSRRSHTSAATPRSIIYDRPRTVCAPCGADGVRWNTTFNQRFADFWGFEPRLCRPYRAQTKGKRRVGRYRISSEISLAVTVSIPRRPRLQRAGPGVDKLTVAEVRVHGTTHERPIDRFVRERRRLGADAGGYGRSGSMDAADAGGGHRLPGHRRHEPLSVPFALIGQSVEVLRRDRVAGDPAPQPGGRHASGARRPSPAPDPARARTGDRYRATPA